MNANELADELDWMTPEKLVGWCNSVQAMLRQQQAEIEALKEQLHWLVQEPAKTLTDEDLNELCPHHEGTATYSVWMNGARTVLSELAILRKAQEK